MPPERWRRIGELFHLALQRPAGERSEFLERACPDDEGLRREVLSLLAQPASADGILDHAVLAQYVADLADVSEIPHSLAGSCFGSYELVALIGAGGMGQVYKARDTRLGREVAIKILPAYFKADSERLTRFLREARAASALNHPNIITIHDIGEGPAGHFIVMELVDGVTFRQLAAERPPLAKVLPLIQQVAKALAAAHAAGIIHRDIKPENLMVRNDGYVKVVDFGLARLLVLTEPASDRTKDATARGRIVGTVRYMSPEQAFGHEVSSATDVFSLGTVLYELATGNHPFAAETTAGLLAAIAVQTQIRAARLNADVPAPLETLLQGMLKKDPRARPCAEDIANEIDSMCGAVFQTSPLRSVAPIRRAMVGREPESAALWAAFQQVRAGRGATVTISGDAGLGKTTLVEGFLTGVETSTWSCLIGRGRCSQRFAGTGGYLPLIEALDDLWSQSPDPAVAHAFQTVAPTWYEQIRSVSQSADSGPSPTPPSPDRIKRELAAVIQHLGAQRPVVLFLDDLHWADASTVDLLAYLMARSANVPLLFVAAYRPSEMQRSNLPFADLKLELTTKGGCEELGLQFLNRENVDRYLDLEYPDHTFPPEFAALIHSRTEGHPLFMVDLLRYLRERGALARETGIWSLTLPVESIENAVPVSVQSMVERKLEQLNEPERRLLVAASVQGDTFDIAVLAAALEMSPADVEEILEPAEHAYGIVRMIEEHELPDRTLTTRYRFVHGLYQNALFSSLRAAKRAHLSRAVAQALLHFHGRNTSKIALQLAFLLEASRDFDQAVDYFLMASQSAQRAGALKEAVVLARRGLTLLEAVPRNENRDRRELTLQMALMVPAVSLGTHNAPDAQAAFKRVRELAESLSERSSLVVILVGRVWARVSAGETHEALEDAEECLRLAEGIDDAGYLVAAHFAAAGVTNQLGDLRRACRHYETAAQHYNPQLHKHLPYLFVSDPGVHVAIEHAYALFHMGEFRHALELASQARTQARQSGHPLSLAAVLTRSIALELKVRRLDDAERFVQELTGVIEQNDVVQRLFLPYYRGWLSALRGNVDEGLVRIQHSVTMMTAAGFRYGLPTIKALIGDLLRMTGRWSEALSLVEQGLSEAHAIGELHIVPELLHQRGTLQLMMAHEPKSAASDVIREGELALRNAIALAQTHGSRFYELRSSVSLARWFLDRANDKEAVALLTDICTHLSDESDFVHELVEARTLLASIQRGVP